MTLPSYLIIGAMKGGTTILYDFINSHPLVTPARKKEIHYFSLHAEKGMNWYESQFDPEATFTGEASPTYFDLATSPSIPRCIEAAIPNVKLILVVRDPVQRALSHFNHLQKINKVEVLKEVSADEFFGHSFAGAVRQTSGIEYYLYQVLSFSCYYRRFLTYRGVFADRLLVLLNEELRERGQETMDKVFDHLGLTRREDDFFSTQRYLHGTDSLPVSQETKDRLRDFLSSDYSLFLKAAGLHNRASEARPSRSQREQAQDTPAVTNPFDVHVGKQGWLFLVGGANRVLDQYREPPPKPETTDRWIQRLRTRRSRFRELGINYLHIVAPNKLSVYPEFYAGPESVAETGVLARLTRAMRGTPLMECYLDPTQHFSTRKPEVMLYFKTDSHWTFFGCFIAYQLICARLGAASNSSLLERRYLQGRPTLDLGARLDPPVRELARFYEVLSNARREFANGLVELKEKAGKANEMGFHVGSHVVFVNERALNPETLVLFGDSFSEYRPHLLTGMLAETFAKVHFIWSANVDFGYVERERPDIVLTQTVERFMPEVPSDSFDVEAFSAERLRKLAGMSVSHKGA